MTIRTDAPEIYQALQEIIEFQQSVSLDAPDDQSLMAIAEAMSNKSGKLFHQFEKLWALNDKFIEKMDAYNLSQSVRDRFLGEVSRRLEDPVCSRIQIFYDSHPLRIPASEFDPDWFSITEFGVGSILDRTTFFFVCHPSLIIDAKSMWDSDLRVVIVEKTSSGSFEDERTEFLQKNGLTADGAHWFWAYEALKVAELGAQRMQLEHQLSDFVVWSCSQEPPDLYNDAQFGEPTLLFKSDFGARITDPNLRRLEGCKIWSYPNGAYASPLWEYLGWGTGRHSEFEEYAKNLADIGEGIDAAVISLDPDGDPDDHNWERNFATRVFRAGQAVVKLRVKMELEDSVKKGLKAASTEKLRAALGGKKSSGARSTRRALLLETLELIASRNPDFSKLGLSSMVELAAVECIKHSPAVWSQGRGQIKEYIGEIRRGEAGVDLQERYFRIFPKKTA